MCHSCGGIGRIKGRLGHVPKEILEAQPIGGTKIYRERSFVSFLSSGNRHVLSKYVIYQIRQPLAQSPAFAASGEFLPHGRKEKNALFLLPSVQMFPSNDGGGLLVGRVLRENDTYAAHGQFCSVYLTQSLVIGAIVVQDAAQFILQGLLFTRKGFDGK